MEPLGEYYTPLPTKELFSNLDETDLELRQKYQSTIEQLMYVMLGTRPDLAHTVGVLSIYSSNPSPDHICAALHAFGYLATSPAAALIFRKDQKDPPTPIYGYTDSNWGSDTETGKSTSGYVFFLSNTTFSWSSRRQETVAGSTMEAEYIVLYHASSNAVWINGFMSEISFPLLEPLEIISDNEAAIRVTSGEELSFKRAKHINIKYHAIQDHVSNNEIAVTQIDSEDNLADQLTKVLPREHFESHLNDLGFEPFYNLT